MVVYDQRGRIHGGEHGRQHRNHRSRGTATLPRTRGRGSVQAGGEPAGRHRGRRCRGRDDRGGRRRIRPGPEIGPRAIGVCGGLRVSCQFGAAVVFGGDGFPGIWRPAAFGACRAGGRGRRGPGRNAGRARRIGSASPVRGGWDPRVPQGRRDVRRRPGRPGPPARLPHCRFRRPPPPRPSSTGSWRCPSASSNARRRPSTASGT